MPVNQSIEVSTRQLRIFLANQAIALGWALRGSCKASAHRLFACAKWLVPEAQRFLVHRTGSYNQYRRALKFAPDLSSLLHRIQPLRVAAGLLIVLVLLGSLDLVTRATVRKSPEVAQGPVLGPVPVPGTQRGAVPLPTRKPQVAYKAPKNKAAKAATQKGIAQRKARSAERPSVAV
jgi:hypothetical protein